MSGFFQAVIISLVISKKGSSDPVVMCVWLRQSWAEYHHRTLFVLSVEGSEQPRLDRSLGAGLLPAAAGATDEASRSVQARSRTRGGSCLCVLSDLYQVGGHASRES